MGLRQDFESALQKLKLELISDIYSTDVLKKDSMIALTTKYNQKIVTMQTDFLKLVASSNPRIKVEFKEPNPKDLSDMGTITLTGLAAGGTVYAGLTFFTLAVVQTSPWFLFWTTTTTTTVTLAAWLAATIGISTTLATGLLTGGVGFIAMAAMYFTYYPVWRKNIRNKLVKDFDEEILPKLRDWADEVINKVNNS
jgi:hypothetical protein